MLPGHSDKPPATPLPPPGPNLEQKNRQVPVEEAPAGGQSARVADAAAQGGVDKFHSATAGSKNRQFKEAR